MTLRLGFVGCGRWGRKLAESFRACGAEIVAYDRKSGHGRTRCPYACDEGFEREPGGDIGGTRCPQGCDAGWENFDPDGFGRYMPWRDQLADKSIDAIVAVAPPEITTEVAMACAAAGKAVMATKPLFDHPERIAAPFYVDFWRLWSEAHAQARDNSTDDAHFWLYGSGPHRAFPGAFDYGPHAMAAALDIDGSLTILDAKKTMGPPGEGYAVALNCERRHRRLFLVYGNGSDIADRRIWGHNETPLAIGAEPREAIMQKFCRSFLNDVSEGHVDPTLLDYSREGMRLLREIREVAK